MIVQFGVNIRYHLQRAKIKKGTSPQRPFNQTPNESERFVVS